MESVSFATAPDPPGVERCPCMHETGVGGWKSRAVPGKAFLWTRSVAGVRRHDRISVVVDQSSEMAKFIPCHPLRLMHDPENKLLAPATSR